MFFKVVYGPVHFQTRILNFFDSNPKTSKEIVYFVDDEDVFDQYKDNYKIIGLDSLRINHEWSNKYELIYKEKNCDEYIKNFYNFYKNKNTLLPSHLHRFILFYASKNNILKFTYLPNNFFMTDNISLLNQYHDLIPSGSFICKTHNWDLDKKKCIPNDENISKRELITKELNRKFPNLTLPDGGYILEYQLFTYSFLNEEHVSLFYELFDSISQIIYENKDSSHFAHFFPFDNLPFLLIDDIYGYIIRLFEINFNYSIKQTYDYWDGSKMGFHLTTLHDTWYYKYDNTKNEEINFKTYYDGKDEHKFIIPKDPNLYEFIKRNKDSINIYLENHLKNRCDFKITPENKVLIRFIEYYG